MGFYIGVEISDHLSPLFGGADKPKDHREKRKARRKAAKRSRRRNR